MSCSPFFNNPVTDFMFLLVPQYWQSGEDSFCSKIEYRFLDCLEAYGTARVREKCAELIYDLAECQTGKAQKRRVNLMRKERMKQYREGKLSTPFEEYPPLDSFLQLPA